jgi:hypothetical protein
MTIQKINVECFDTHNTAFTKYGIETHSIRDYGKTYSNKYHHIIISNMNGWEEYEKGDFVSWSYPNGCGQIKINS